MCVYLRAKFQILGIILTSFRQGVILPLPTAKRTSKRPTQISVKKTYLSEVYLEPSQLSLVKLFGKNLFARYLEQRSEMYLIQAKRQHLLKVSDGVIIKILST